MKKIFNFLFLSLGLIYCLFRIISCSLYYYCGVSGKFLLVEPLSFDYYWTIILNSIILTIAIGVIFFFKEIVRSYDLNILFKL